MLAEKYLLDFKKKFDPLLISFLDRKQKQAEKIDPCFQTAIKEIKRLCQAGGKRIRPALVYTGFKAVAGKAKIVWPCCLAVELIHAFALIHDDIMDQADCRRGEQSCFKKLGLNQAILTGDVSLILAEELIPCQAKKYFNLLKLEIAGGQWLDVKRRDPAFAKATAGEERSRLCQGYGGRGEIPPLPRLRRARKELEIMKIMELKTGRYTISRPLQIGAQLAGKEENKKVLEAFFAYGISLGTAFQIQDDILNIFGIREGLGKPVGSDISEGKKTLLVDRLQDYKGDRLQGERRMEEFWSFFGQQKPLTKEQLELTRQVMVESGALNYCRGRAVQLAEQGKRAIRELEIRQKEKKFLIALADFLIKRTY